MSLIHRSVTHAAPVAPRGRLAASRAVAAPQPVPRPSVDTFDDHTRRDRRRTFWARLLHARLTLTALALIVLLAALAALAPWIAPHDPVHVDLEQRLAPPSAVYVLGTDQFGRDIFSRLLFGARLSLGTATLVLASVMSLSLALGMVAGYAGGRIDDLVMRVVDTLLALPNLVLAIAIVGVLGVGLGNLMLAVMLTSWAYYARLVRGMVLQAREHDYVLAARACGAGPLRIALRHVLPAIAGPLLVLASLDVGRIILSISGLSFLGLGAQPPAPEWGAMLNDGRAFFHAAPHLMVYPGVAITLTVLAFNLMGDGLRDLLDPHTVRRE